MKPRIPVFVAALAAALICAPRAVAQQAAAENPLAALSFMAGCWRGEMGPGAALEENWTAANTNVMLATARYLRNGRTTGFEFSRIHADSARVTLRPYPGGEASDSFPMARSGPGLAVFENLAHDFPKRIIYRRVDARTLAIRIEGDQDAQAQEWTMARVACGEP
jgi:Domain of unknown function (DUF6265)